MIDRGELRANVLPIGAGVAAFAVAVALAALLAAIGAAG